MRRRALFACLAVCACSQPVWAQTRMYVSGDVFAEVIRFPQQTLPPEIVTIDGRTPDGVTAGGGVRIGAFFSPAWSLELGVDLGKEISDTKTIPVAIPAGFPSPLTVPSYQSRTGNRFSATSVLIGFHPPARGRAQAGFRGGLSVMRTDSSFTYVSTSFSLSTTIPSAIGPVTIFQPNISLKTSQLMSQGYGIFASIAGEVAISVSSHFAVVPEVRAHINTNTLVVRPGVAARWQW